jgi:REP element-mobilizing transposase RayT
MTRPLRLQFPGAVYHVTSRGTRRGPIYHDARDYHIWQNLLGETAARYNFAIHAFCQMPNHFHMLVETADGNLSQGMRHLNSRYAQRFNYRYRSCGPVLQGRFHSILIEHQSQLLEVARYVVLNPVRARLVRAEAEWMWSSHSYLIGHRPPPFWLSSTWLLAQFGRTVPKARAAYIQFVEQGRGGLNPLSSAQAGLVLGRAPDDMELSPSALPLKGTSRRARRVLAHALSEYAALYPDRNEAMARAFNSTVYSMREIGAFFGVSERTVGRAVRAWEKKASDPAQLVYERRI